MVVLALALSTAALFPDAYFVAGLGAESCATAFSDSHEPYTRQWIAGFVSGANAVRGARTGFGTDLPGIVGEVKIVCDKEPAKPLTWAAQQAYRKLLAW